MNKILIGVCNGGAIQSDTVSSLLSMIAAGAEDSQLMFVPLVGGYKTFNMNHIGTYIY